MDDLINGIIALEGLVEKGKELLFGVLQNRKTEIFLAGKIVIKIPLLHPRSINDIIDAGMVKSLGNQNSPCRFDNIIASYLAFALAHNENQPFGTNIDSSSMEVNQ